MRSDVTRVSLRALTAALTFGALAATATHASAQSINFSYSSRPSWNPYGYNGYNSFPTNSYSYGVYPLYGSSNRVPYYVCRNHDPISGRWYTGYSNNGRCYSSRPSLGRTLVNTAFNLLTGVGRRDHSWRPYSSSWYTPWYNSPNYWNHRGEEAASDDKTLKEICKADVLGTTFTGTISNGKCYMPSPTGVDLIRDTFDVMVLN